MTSIERLAVLARFIRNQISLADRPPVGRIELNNEEASLCADALEAVERLRAHIVIHNSANGEKEAKRFRGTLEPENNGHIITGEFVHASCYDELRVDIARYDELERFAMPLSCETHGLVPNLAWFNNKCPQCEVERLKRRADNHAETLRGIAAMNPVTEGDRMRQWAQDGLSGYTESVEATVKNLMDQIEQLTRERDEAFDKRDAERQARWATTVAQKDEQIERLRTAIRRAIEESSLDEIRSDLRRLLERRAAESYDELPTQAAVIRDNGDAS